MSTVKISELPLITALNANTAQTIFLAVDTITDVTGRFTGTTLAEGLYSHNVLNVGNNEVILPDVVAQFAGSSDNYLQLNLQNNSGNGSGDIVITANNGTDSTYYIDMGLNGSSYNYDGFTYAKPLDGYLIVQGDTSATPGGNLVIGTTTPNKNVSILLGSIDSSGIMAQFVHNQGFKMIGKPIIFQDNTSQNTAAAPFIYSNASFLHANSSFTHANAAILKANAAFIVANSGATFANTAADTAAQAIINASTADSKAVTAGNYANSAFLRANTPSHVANSAALYANGAFIQANAAFESGNATSSYAYFGYTHANSAFDKANNALANTSGTFNGNLSVTGNLSLLNGSLSSAGNMTVNGTMVLANSNFTATQAAITIKATANVAVPANDGYMLHISGKQNVPSRIVFDAYSSNGAAYGLVAGRTARGNVDYPAPVQSGDVLLRISGNGYGTNQFAPSPGIAHIDFVATETYTNSARGSAIKMYNIENGSNTLTQIASFNANVVTFLGTVEPQKGFAYTPRLPSGSQTTISISFITDSIIKANLVNDLTVSFSDYKTGKIVELWLTNASGSQRIITHGCSALNSTINSTTFNMPATSSAYLKYFSIDGDLANTFVFIIHA
jgi:formylmethanofuran dehydrogenase subunit C